MKVERAGRMCESKETTEARKNVLKYRNKRGQEECVKVWKQERPGRMC